MDEHTVVEASGFYADEFRKFLKKNEKNKEKHKTEYVFVGAALLLAGFIRDTQFVAKVNERFGNEDLGKVNVGEALAVMMLMLALGLNNIMSDQSSSIRGLLQANLLGLDPSIEPSDFSPQVLGKALDIFAQGGQQFFQEFTNAAYKQYGLITEYGLADVTEVHVNSTSMLFYKAQDNNSSENTDPTSPEGGDERKDIVPSNKFFDHFDAAVAADRDELKKAYQTINYYNGKYDCFLDFNPEAAAEYDSDVEQIVICNVAEGTRDLQLFTKLAAGDSKERSLFATIASESLPVLTKQFQTLKYWVCNIAGCTQETFDAVTKHQVAIVTRVPNNMPFTKDVLKQMQDRPEQWQSVLNELDKNESKPNPNTLKSQAKTESLKAFMCQGELFGHKVVALAIYNPTLTKNKEASAKKKAEAECAKLTKALDKRYKSQATADANAQKLIDKAEYCDIELKGHDGKEKQVKSKTQPKDPAKLKTELVDVKVLADVTISQTKLKEAIEQECCYVLVTTDTEREWTPFALYKMYQRNTNNIETMWRMQQYRCQYLNDFFLQNDERIASLAVLLSLDGFAHSLMQAVIRNAVDKKILMIPNDEDTAYDLNPTLNRICQHFQHVSMLFEQKSKGKIKIEPCGIDEFVFGILVILGENWRVLFRPKTYKGSIAQRVLASEK